MYNKLEKKLGKSYFKKKMIDEIRSRVLLEKVTKGSLLPHYKNVHSQIGQDGILEEIFKRIGIKKGFFCEFGAWDGVYLSNCRKLFEEGWSGVFIEANKKKFSDLQYHYKDCEHITCICSLVGAPKNKILGDPLSLILNNNGIKPETVDFLSIDVDGCDLEIFEEINFQPKVVLLEGGLHFKPEIVGRATAKVRNTFHHPLKEIINTVKHFEYVPVCFLHDLYLVRKDLSKQFKKFDVDQLYEDSYLGAPKWLRGKMDEAKTNKILEKEEIRLSSN